MNSSSLGGIGDVPRYEPVAGIEDEYEMANNHNIQAEPLNYRRARVLCSYDAKDNSELNLVANEVKFWMLFASEFTSRISLGNFREWMHAIAQRLHARQARSSQGTRSKGLSRNPRRLNLLTNYWKSRNVNLLNKNLSTYSSVARCNNNYSKNEIFERLHRS